MRPTAVPSRLAAAPVGISVPVGFARAISTLALCISAGIAFASGAAFAQSGNASQEVSAERRAITGAVTATQQSALAKVDAGDRSIEANTTVDGDALARNGSLTVRGTVNGDAIALDGDIISAVGSHITGNAIAINGRVRDEGGVIDGEMRVLKAAGPTQPALSKLKRTEAALKAVALVFGVGLLIALVVLVTAQDPLEAVARAAERDISASFWVGVLWQLLAIPILIVSMIALAVTVVGILAIPLAIVAWAIAYTGAITLGLFAVSVLIGRVFIGTGRSVHDRGALLWTLLVGLTMLAMVWAVTAGVVSIPTISVLSRVAALALTWVAATVGLGAVVRSRGGTKPHAPEPTAELQMPSWQTPTPVSGVVAARRPTPINTHRVE